MCFPKENNWDFIKFPPLADFPLCFPKENNQMFRFAEYLLMIPSEIPIRKLPRLPTAACCISRGGGGGAWRGSPWPCPPPYAWREAGRVPRSARAGQRLLKRRALQVMVNLATVGLSLLHGRRRRAAPHVRAERHRCSRRGACAQLGPPASLASGEQLARACRLRAGAGLVRPAYLYLG